MRRGINLFYWMAVWSTKIRWTREPPFSGFFRFTSPFWCKGNNFCSLKTLEVINIFWHKKYFSMAQWPRLRKGLFHCKSNGSVTSMSRYIEELYPAMSWGLCEHWTVISAVHCLAWHHGSQVTRGHQHCTCRRGCGKTCRNALPNYLLLLFKKQHSIFHPWNLDFVTGALQRFAVWCDHV